MVAFDTNVLVRLLVGDDPPQTKKAEDAFLRHARGDGVYVSLVVLAEVAWVLTSGYDLDRSTIRERIQRLVRTRGVLVEDLELVVSALDAYGKGAADFADYLILGRASSVGARPLLTFDRRLSREKGVSLL